MCESHARVGQGYNPSKASSMTEITVGVVCDNLACLQTWAKIEEGVGGFQRAAELRSYRMQGINDIMLPSSFGISLSQEPADSPLKAVVLTVCLLLRPFPLQLQCHDLSL